MIGFADLTSTRYQSSYHLKKCPTWFVIESTKQPMNNYIKLCAHSTKVTRSTPEICWKWAASNFSCVKCAWMARNLKQIPTTYFTKMTSTAKYSSPILAMPWHAEHVLMTITHMTIHCLIYASVQVQFNGCIWIVWSSGWSQSCILKLVKIVRRIITKILHVNYALCLNLKAWNNKIFWKKLNKLTYSNMMTRSWVKIKLYLKL